MRRREVADLAASLVQAIRGKAMIRTIDDLFHELIRFSHDARLVIGDGKLVVLDTAGGTLRALDIQSAAEAHKRASGAVDR
jgi:hypothetical protein